VAETPQGVTPGSTAPPDPATGAQSAAAYLRQLLLRPGRYRRKWEQYSERSRRGQINQLAVAEVLAHYLWEHPRNSGDTDVLPRQLKDTSSRALSGKLLSKSALALFMDAFDLDVFERDQLMKLWEGSARVRVLSGPAGIRDDRAQGLGPPKYRTLSLHDHHYLGPDGFPARHRNLQVVEALEDGIDRVLYRADTNAVAVEVLQGAYGLGGPVRQIADGLFAVDMLLAKKLQAGETATLEYETSFHYSTRPPPEFRRIVVISLENLDIRVQFHPDFLPRTVLWAVWDGMDGPIAESEPVELDAQFAAHRFLRVAQRTVVGFHWDWLRYGRAKRRGCGHHQCGTAGA
jgi:hypothetical protein